MESTKSEFNVEVVRIFAVQPHGNADRLEIIHAEGCPPVVAGKGDFKAGGLAVYVPIDAIVPVNRPEHPEFHFLRQHEGDTTARIKARRFRGVYSEGLLIPIPGWFDVAWGPGTNVQEKLGIGRWLSPAERRELTKPPHRTRQMNMLEQAANRFMPTYGVDPLLRFQDVIPKGTRIIVTEKLHGTNARFAWHENRLWVGSHKTLRGVTRHRVMELVNRGWLKFLSAFGIAHRARTFAEHGDVWWKIAEQEHLAERLRHFPDWVFYGEIYGNGLQVRGGIRFDYDCPTSYGFRVFDVYDSKSKRFFPYQSMRSICEEAGLLTVPELAVGRYEGVDALKPMTLLKSRLSEHMREGVVIRDDVWQANPERHVLKLVSENYKLLTEE